MLESAFSELQADWLKNPAKKYDRASESIFIYSIYYGD